MIGGFTEDGDRIDALIVGYYAGRQLLAAGKVRAGLTPLSRRELRVRLLPYRKKTCPFANLPDTRSSHWGEGITAEEMDTIIWLKPQVVAEVAFTESTRDAHLRHAQFVNPHRQASARRAARRLSTGGSFLDDSPAVARRRLFHG